MMSDAVTWERERERGEEQQKRVKADEEDDEQRREARTWFPFLLSSLHKKWNVVTIGLMQMQSPVLHIWSFCGALIFNAFKIGLHCLVDE